MHTLNSVFSNKCKWCDSTKKEIQNSGIFVCSKDDYAVSDKGERSTIPNLDNK